MAVPLEQMGSVASLAFASAFGGAVIIYALVTSISHVFSYSQFPLINQKRLTELTLSNARRRFVHGSQALIKEGFKKSKGIFRLVTDVNEKLILHQRYFDELKNDERLSTVKFFEKEYLAHTPGLEPFGQSLAHTQMLRDVIMLKLPKAIDKTAFELREEAEYALKTLWTDNTEWHEVIIKPTVLGIISRVTSLAFLGPELCRDPSWLDLMPKYTVAVLHAVSKLRLWPKLLRPIIHWFLPEFQRVRALLKDARAVIEPVLQRRVAEKEAALAQGKPPKVYSDALAWLDEAANDEPYDPALSQMVLVFAAMHTSTDTLTQSLYNLCGQEELIEALRKEAVDTLNEYGWTKTGLYKMKLMDSVLKETLRLKPLNSVALKRVVTEDITLHDGVQLPKGAVISISCDSMWEDAVYYNARTFDGYRYLKLAQDPQTRVGTDFVSTSVDHLGFGHGRKACPGRFFAASALKIILIQMVMGYEWKLADGVNPTIAHVGLTMQSDPTARLLIRRRQS